MDPKKTKNSYKEFLNNTSASPLFIGIATGLYPLVFYYSRNFGMINSLEQFGYFLLLFFNYSHSFLFVFKMVFQSFHYW